jgi:hypothetical protein
MKPQRIKKKLRRQEKKKLRAKAKKKRLNLKKNKGKNIVFSLHKTIIHNFPDLYERMRKLEDYRKNSHYELAELITACIAMFIFKKGSRNAMNNERENKRFKKNYERIFKMRLPHMDTVDEVMRQINETELENLKTELVKSLIMRKVFYKFRFFGKYYRVAVDGSHVMNVKEGHCEHCQKRTSKKSGKTTYFHNVLEAKLVCANGFSISLATEWIENPDEDYNKQDCEQKAFIRLAQKLKQAYPRLPICIVADALYPNQSFFRICRDNDWCWVVTFKDGNLPSVWEEVLGLQKIIHENIRYKEQKQKKKTSNNNIPG